MSGWGKTSGRRGAHLALAALAVHVALGCDGGHGPEGGEAFQRATNRGSALLENRDASGALETLAQAAALAPGSARAQRNLARAHLLASDAEAALEALARAEALAPENASTAYLTGIAYLRDSRYAEAVAPLEQAARLDPETAAIRFQLADAYQAVGRDDDAGTQLRDTLRLEPLHLSAHYRLAGQARRRGDDEALARWMQEIARLRRIVGDEDRSSEALEVCVHTQPERAPTPTPKVPSAPPPWPFAPAADAPGALAAAVAATPLSLDADGRYASVAIGPDGVVRALFADDGTPASEAPGAPRVPEALLEARTLRLVVGNVFDDVPADVPYDPERHAFADALVVTPAGARLFLRRPDGGFRDATERAGLADVRGEAARLLDYDHDGDLDLAVGGQAGLALWQNDGAGRFADVTAEVGLALAGPVVDLAAVDLDADGAIDLVVARGGEPTIVFEGQRTGTFARLADPPGPLPPARRLAVDDVDGDGVADAALVGDDALAVVRTTGGTPLRASLGAGQTTAATLTDVDADGRLEVALVHRAAGVAVLRVFDVGADGLRERSAPTSPALPDGAHALAAFDADGDGDRDLWLAAGGGLQLLDNTGPGGGLLKLRLQGTKSNPSGIGIRVTARAAGFRATRFVQDPVAEIGLGDHAVLDALQVLWTNGIVDNTVDLSAPSAPITFLEKSIAAGSCPYLYAWDGAGFRFVTDLLGNAPIGLSERRGVPLPADPEEIVAIGPSASLPARDGAFVVQVTDELREVAYLDSVRLVAVDHPAHVEVHPTDRVMFPPFPTSELWPLLRPRAPRSATGDDGIDRTADVAAADGRFAPPGPRVAPQLRGMTRELVLTLDFGPLREVRHPVLALTGWLQWGDASRNIALSQNPDAVVVPPTLEMEVAPGEWRTVDVVVGMPSGKTKTIVVDLDGTLAPTARRLRLRTSFELRWDRIALLERAADTEISRHTLAPTRATLAERGYSDIRARAPGHPTTPRHATLLSAPPWDTMPTGFATRLGDTLPLVAERDSRLAVLVGGDALELAFADTLPPLAPGHQRSFFFYSVGWDKDEDHNVIDGTTIEPLPVDAGPDDDQRATHHTRFVPRDAPLRSGR